MNEVADDNNATLDDVIHDPDVAAERERHQQQLRRYTC